MLFKSLAFNEEKLKELIELYAYDIDNFNRVQSEVTLQNIYLDDKCIFDLFPNVFKLLKILITFPVTSVEAE